MIFAVINYINLTVAQAGFRAKEMATRRLLGSSRGELFMRLMLESTLLTFISLIIGVLLALAVVPFVNDLLQTRVDMNVLGRPVWLLALVSLTVAVGVLSGLLPAIIISSSKSTASLYEQLAYTCCNYIANPKISIHKQPQLLTAKVRFLFINKEM